MKWWLSKSAVQLREQIDDYYMDRDRTSDGSVGDLRHSARRSHHNPCPKTGVVRAIDIDADLMGKKKPVLMPDLADQIRLYAKSDKAKRIEYLIFDGKIASARKAWRWRPYTGINRHRTHLHVSFTPKGDHDSSFFNIPLLGGTNDKDKR
jgi:hypothetical protein